MHFKISCTQSCDLLGISLVSYVFNLPFINSSVEDYHWNTLNILRRVRPSDDTPLQSCPNSMGDHLRALHLSINIFGYIIHNYSVGPTCSLPSINVHPMAARMRSWERDRQLGPGNDSSNQLLNKDRTYKDFMQQKRLDSFLKIQWRSHTYSRREQSLFP